MSVAVLAIFILVAVPSAQASATTYQINLETTSNGLYSGTGSFTVSTTGTNQDFTFLGTNDLLSLSLTINGETFNATGGCNVSFSGGTVNSIYGCTFGIGNNSDTTILHTSIQLGNNSYSFNYTEGMSEGGTNGSVTFGPGVVTPEPSTLFLWGTGLLALGAIFRKKLGVNPTV